MSSLSEKKVTVGAAAAGVVVVGNERRTRRRTKRREVAIRVFWQLAILVVVLGLWQILSDDKVINPAVAASPSAIWTEFKQLLLHGSLLDDVWATLEETVIGVVLGVVLGVVIGTAVGFMPRVRDVLDPYVALLNSAPRLALAPLFIFWFGIGIASKVILVITIVGFVAYLNTIEGVQSINEDMLNVARLYGANRRQLVTKIVAPSMVPWILASLRMSIALGIIGAVIGELFGAYSGLGYLITEGAGVFNVPEVFVALLSVMIIAGILDFIVRLFIGRALRWRDAGK